MAGTPHSAEQGTRPSLARRAWRALRDALYGLFLQDHVLEVYRLRAQAESLYLFVTLGDILGFPVLPPYYSLRILPYALPRLEGWRRYVLREKDITDYA